MSTNGVAFLAVGHVTSDLIEGRETPGGSALYCALQARTLGARPRVLTAAAPDWPGHAGLAGIEVHTATRNTTTTFEYLSVTPRLARLRSTADPLRPEDLPAGWVRSDIGLLCPVFGEVDSRFSSALEVGLLGATAQGWMRRLGADNRVERGLWGDPATALEKVDVVFFSTEDAEDAEALAQRLRRVVGTVVLTRGALGSSVYQGDSRIDVPARPAREVDPTGAGDVFAAAYLIATWEGASSGEAASFASAAAACAVEGPGVSGIRGRGAIAARQTR